MKEKLLYLMLILFVSASVFAQTGGGSAAFTIKGQVVDSLSNESVPYATLRIALASAPQNPVKLLACDDDGKFTATMNKPGKYVMTMESLGKVPAKKTFTISWMAVVAAELIASLSGIGYRMSNARSLMQSDVVIVCMILIGLIGILMDKILGGIFTVITPWNRKQK